MNVTVIDDGNRYDRVLVVTLPVDDVLVDGSADDAIVAEVSRLVRDCLTDHRARQVLAWAIEGLGHTLTDLQSTSQRVPLVHDRHEFMLRLREAGWSLPKIGRLLFRDHTTVLHGVAQAEARRASKVGAAEVAA